MRPTGHYGGHRESGCGHARGAEHSFCSKLLQNSAKRLPGICICEAATWPKLAPPPSDHAGAAGRLALVVESRSALTGYLKATTGATPQKASILSVL